MNTLYINVGFGMRISECLTQKRTALTRIFNKVARFCLISQGLLTVFLCPSVIAGSYSVEGSLSYEVILQDQPHPPLKRYFKVTFNDGQWEIRMILGTKEFEYFIYQYDGTNLLSFATFPLATQKNATGILESNPVPQSWTSAAGEYVWLAYASSWYFKDLTTHQAMSISPITSSEGLTRREILPCVWKLDSQPPFLPFNVEYTRDVYRHLVKDGLILTNHLAHPFYNGYSESCLTTSNRTNIGGMNMPKDFHYRKFIPNPKAKTSNDLTCIVLVDGFATNFIVPDTLIFTKPANLHVRDDRPIEPQVHYPVTNLNIPSTNNLFVQVRIRDAAVKNQMHIRTHKSSKYIAFVFLITIIFLLPFIIIHIVRKKEKE